MEIKSDSEEWEVDSDCLECISESVDAWFVSTADVEV